MFGVVAHQQDSKGYLFQALLAVREQPAEAAS